MVSNGRVWCLLFAAAGSSSCDSGGVCFAASQSELNEKLLDERCLDVRVLEFDSETLVASSERDDVDFGLYIDPSYCSNITADGCGDEGGALRHATVDNIYVNMSEDLESLVVSRYRGGMIQAKDIELTLDGARGGRDAVYFQVRSGGRVSLRSLGSMNEWRHVSAAALPSWDGVTVEVDPSAWPTNELSIAGSEAMTLSQLQQFGSRAQTVNVGALAVDVVEAYATWLEAEGFSGTLSRFVDSETIVVLPRAAAPAP